MKGNVLLIDSSPRIIDFTISEESAMFFGVEQGAWKLAQNKIPMVLAIGDFDSISNPELAYLKSITNVIKLPSHKKYSDMEEAILLAKNYGFKKIYIICDIARLDQLLVNIELVKKYSVIMFTNQGMIAKLTPFVGNVFLRKHNYKYISFFPITKQVSITTSKALAYKLPNILKKDDTTIYVSNELTAPILNIKVEHGELLVVQASDPKFINRRILN